MTEPLRRDVHRDTGLPQQRGVRMPEVVESDTRDCGAANEVAERCSEVPRDDRRTIRASEDESVVVVGGSQERRVSSATTIASAPTPISWTVRIPPDTSVSARSVAPVKSSAIAPSRRAGYSSLGTGIWPAWMFGIASRSWSRIKRSASSPSPDSRQSMMRLCSGYVSCGSR